MRDAEARAVAAEEAGEEAIEAANTIIDAQRAKIKRLRAERDMARDIVARAADHVRGLQATQERRMYYDTPRIVPRPGQPPPLPQEQQQQQQQQPGCVSQPPPASLKASKPAAGDVLTLHSLVSLLQGLRLLLWWPGDEVWYRMRVGDVAAEGGLTTVRYETGEQEEQKERLILLSLIEAGQVAWDRAQL
ncbi:hypothetical protein MNEG_4359 [Monoraphidium neglectum]|uniref:Uncharacterized protein n=1 Tax=Monoraphidium neglectum TaxID=145388 RepID=A0A0D2JYF8_9CHLO|nr:hypothetical protein MNEG_4359 [Monoraphidium neglectum]KIZ03598.1 hypothetical protein MNEG_4359 [Monoraphidium neglectum]|eukprot:XP_013902617.1 hypothetical protein MNEG_4359 [Monoraphidium neglectum]